MATIYRSPGISTVFSLLSNVQNFSMPYPSIKPISSAKTYSVPPRTIHILPTTDMWVLLSCALLRGHLCAPSASSTRLLVYLLFFLAGPGPLHKNAVSVFPRSRLMGPCKYFFIPISPLGGGTQLLLALVLRPLTTHPFRGGEPYPLLIKTLPTLGY